MKAKTNPMDNKQEKLEKFWKTLGFRYEQTCTDGTGRVYYPDGSILPVTHEYYPDLDLNNLFKYAFEKMIEAAIRKFPYFTHRRAICYLFYEWQSELQKEPDYATALYTVAREVIDGK